MREIRNASPDFYKYIEAIILRLPPEAETDAPRFSN